MTTSPLPPGPPRAGEAEEVLLDVALLGTRRLVGEAVRTALSMRRDRVTRHPLPADRRRAPELVRRMVEDGAVVLLVLCEAGDLLEVGDAAAVVAASVVPALVLCDAEQVDRDVLLGAGATAVLPMSTRVDELQEALARAAAAGRPVPPPQPARRTGGGRAQTAEAGTSSAPLGRLTRRESEVLAALSRGLSVGQIAEETGVSVGTVRSHVRAILHKLGTTSQLGAVAVLHGHGDGRSRPSASR